MSSIRTSPTRLTTKAARHQYIAELLEHNAVASQAALAGLLRDEGFDVTQATLSRDLDELRAVKVATGSGVAVYAIPQDGGDPTPTADASDASVLKLQRVVGELMSSVDHSANMVVLRTPPGAAQYLASAIDHNNVAGILGTVAGDDTVLIVTRDPKGGSEVADYFAQVAQRRRHATPRVDG
jgi:transcriptional regulator of arginine metabolism